MVRSAFLSLALAALGAAIPLASRQITCASDSGLYIIVARGSYEDVGEGSPGQVATMIEAAVPGSSSVAVVYPADFGDINIDLTNLIPSLLKGLTTLDLVDTYFESVQVGVEDTKAEIANYVAACGNASRIALVGYSQGGNVMTDVLAGGLLTEAIDEQYRQNIIGVAVFGDPTFVAGESFNVGNSTHDGLFPRSSSNLAQLNTWSSVLRSYCIEGDPVCSGIRLIGSDINIHYAEVTTWAQNATDFIAGLAVQS